MTAIYGFTSGEYSLPNGDAIDVTIRIDVEVPEDCTYSDDDLNLDTIADDALSSVYEDIERELGINED